MDDNDVCPLCCEELDISDQQFFPCKCGYQVCMWCWHRIKESESGLCPACRTPYGDDPHEFSAVDMEEVVKANKEKAAAEKKEKERLRQQQAVASGASGAYGVGGMHIGGGSDGDLAVVTAGGLRGHLDPPKDRNQLANMRVIRRNLVYAVGLPPSVATEDILKKAEYFGQYGKISKIVLNRNHNGNGDPRRASASAYVTFAHKEDALACILALDGFYVDGRNTRASYGTSKYCSAFIKNVRCNNPDCTYLHCMGDSEDTFTKQEIQAGYVTSGRDVLARQQQIAAASSGPGARRRVGSGGPSGTGRVASSPTFPPPTYDEPSKPSMSSLVPPPPPATSSTTQFPPVGSSMQRATTSSSIVGFSSVAAGNSSTSSLVSVAAAGKMSRSTSLPGTCMAVPLAKPEPALTPAEILSRQQEELRKKHPQNSTNTNRQHQSGSNSSGNQSTQGSSSNSNGTDRSSSDSFKNIPVPAPVPPPLPAPATAASVVAGVHSTTRGGASQPPPPHTTLTALTPLKRSVSLPERRDNAAMTKNTIATKSDSQQNQNLSISKNLSAAEQAAVIEQRKEAFLANNRPPKDTATKLSALRSNSMTLPAHPTTSVSSDVQPNAPPTSRSIGSIGGKVIGGPIAPPAPINSIAMNQTLPGLGSIGGQQIGKNTGFGSIGPSSLGMENNGFGGQAIGSFAGSGGLNGSSILSQPLLGGGADKNQWGLGESKVGGSDGIFGNPDGNFGPIGGTGIWGDSSSQDNRVAGPPGNAQHDNGGPIGGTRLNDMSKANPVGPSSGGSLLGNNNYSGDLVSGSSALASMLGIELPTGVGSLRETLWASSTPVKGPSEVKINTPTPIGAGIKKSNAGVIIGGRPTSIDGAGGVPIGGYSSSSGPPSGSNKNDFALLQSLLPGVHITNGNAYQPAAPNASSVRNHNPFGGPGWGGLSNSQSEHQQPIGVGGLMPNGNQRYQQPNESWSNNSGFYAPGPAPQKQNNSHNQDQPNIW